MTMWLSYTEVIVEVNRQNMVYVEVLLKLYVNTIYYVYYIVYCIVRLLIISFNVVFGVLSENIFFSIFRKSSLQMLLNTSSEHQILRLLVFTYISFSITFLRNIFIKYKLNYSSALVTEWVSLRVIDIPQFSMQLASCIITDIITTNILNHFMHYTIGSNSMY